MNVQARRGGLLTVAIFVVLLPALLYGLLRHSSAQAKLPVASLPDADSVSAAAPGQVDVLGGTRHLSAQADGVVQEVVAASNHQLAAGAILLRLDEHQAQLDEQAAALDVERLQLDVASQTAQVRSAAADVERLRPLVAQQAEPAEMLRQAEMQSRNAGNALKLAQIELAAGKLHQHLLAAQREQRLLRAPVAGRVLRVDTHAGESVSRGTPLIWFEPDAAQIVRAELDERLLSRLHVGMRAEVEAEYGGGHVFPAQLTAVADHIGPARLPVDGEVMSHDDRVVECTLSLGASDLLLGQRVVVRFLDSP